jgi:uncharacterized Zn finger protein
MTPKWNKIPKQIKCPKCGDFRQTEVTKTWGTRIEIYCETCGKISIVENSGEL